jgi:hypothetical protein
MVNWKGSEKMQSCPNLCTYLHLHGGTEKTVEISQSG